MSRVIVAKTAGIMSIPPTRSRIAVIGLGLAGITSVKNLVEQGFEDVTGFERNDKIGGLWQFNEDPKQTTALKTTRVNGSKHFSAYQDFPFPDDVPDYPTAAQVADYLNAYAREFNIEKHFRLGAKIIRLAPAPASASSSNASINAEHVKDDTGPTRWTLRYTDSTGEHEEEYDKVLVTNGSWGRTFIPTFSGMDGYQGKVLHAQAYKGPEPYEGKKVVVVGLGNTGGDIAVSLVGTAAKVYGSHRSGTRILQRYPGKSTKPFDHRITRRRWISGAKMNARFPRFTSWLGSLIAELMFKWYNPRYKPEWGFFPAPPIATSPGAVQDDLVRMMADGEIHNLFGIKAFTPTGIITKTRDGTGEVETECDAVIFATGYSAELSFCEGEASPYSYPTPEWDSLGTKNNLVPYPYLYMTLFSPSSPESLAFIGPCRGFSAIAFSNCDSSSQAICQVWKGAYTLPPKKERLEWCAQIYERNLHIAKLYRNTRTGMDPLEFEQWLNEVIGNQVNDKFGWGAEAWKFWWSDRKLYKLIMDGVYTPFVYRLWDGKEGSRKKWEGARKAIYHANGLTLGS